MADTAEDDRRRPFAGTPIVICILSIALSLAACNPTQILDALTGGGDAYCAGLDTDALDPLNPAHRDCYCSLYGTHPVCRPDIVVGS
ncbi:MAG: hypothetical protein H6884_02300 [Rhodobiaceae bacterium]|nr:hypothetical protein [Rhodobiaceae bacterium]MCC0052872.1 hypothetical protein [Rhodobiaceae bacterium]